METQADWRHLLSSSARYENIQTIKAGIEAAVPSTTTAQKDAFLLENEAYKTSSTLDEYMVACRYSPPNDGSASAVPPASLEGSQNDAAPESVGVRIGPYSNCHYIASGVTAEVYRADARALKVITETRAIEPHHPFREAKILETLKKPCIPLLETFRDHEERFVLVFPYMPLSLDAVLTQGPISKQKICNYFTALFGALDFIHAQGIIHRDVKPSAVLLESPDGPAYLSDFGTAWHPDMSAGAEPRDQKILDIGTGPYRAPEALFGDRSYGPPLDMWAAGTMLAECCRNPPRPLFESRPAHEDGNQLGLILSIFKTLGTPTLATWPEAASYRTPPFEMYTVFEGSGWDHLLSDVDADFHQLITALVKYESSTRSTASEALRFKCLKGPESNVTHSSVP